MELLNQEEIHSIVKAFGCPKVVNWSIENYADKLIGYLGDHLRLKIEADTGNGITAELNLFVKCMPRFDQWKANYLKELSFFKKEYVMLSRLFNHFQNENGSDQWRPKLLFIKEDLFVFEDVVQLGYKMRSTLDYLSYDDVMATVRTVAKFHAQSYIFEENKSKEYSRPYSIYEDYGDYLQEPVQGMDWRNTGRNAVIDYLKVFSKYRNQANFAKSVEVVIPMLFDGAFTLMKPSPVYRNAVVHRDLWTNNIFLKEHDDGEMHAMIVDFQTVLYCSPMLDLSSLLFFNTTRVFRERYTNDILDIYYEVLSEELKCEGIDIETIFSRTTLDRAYEESIMFGITQAAIIVPIVSMGSEKREELFSNPKTCSKINVISRSAEFIKIAKKDNDYRIRVTELFDEIVDRYVYKS